MTGASELVGDVTFGGNIVGDANEAKTIFAATTSNAITVGGGTSSTQALTGITTVGATLSVAGASELVGDATFGGNIVGAL